MRLLPAAEIHELVTSGDGRLQIENYSSECLQHTTYYFRLGRRYQRRDASGDYDTSFELPQDEPFLQFSTHEYIQTWTLEKFALDHTILGILGPVSDVGRNGLMLVNSPFIDPLYPGMGLTAPLEVGLANLNPGGATIRAGARIGKVAFFDISDSGPIELDLASESARKFAERRQEAREPGQEEGPA